MTRQQPIKITERGLCKEIERQIFGQALYDERHIDNSLRITSYTLASGGQVFVDNDGKYVVFGEHVDRQVLQKILSKSMERSA